MSTELADVSKAVAEFDRVAAGLGALQKTYGGIVYEVSTTKGMEEAKAARLAIRAPRYEIENVRKAAKAPLLELGKKLDSEAKRITAELQKIEDPIHQQIANEEERKERERQEKIAAELKRVTDIHASIELLRGNPTLTVNSGSVAIQASINQLAAMPVDESFMEYTQQAKDARAAGLFRLGELLIAAQTNEAERAELARLREEQARRDKEDRERLAEEERVAKVARDAAAAEQADANRKEREATEAANRAERERQAAEDKRLREEREQLARDQEALRAAQAAAAAPPPPRTAAKARKALKADMGNGLTVQRGADGHWMQIDHDSKSAAIHVESVLQNSFLVRDAFIAWIDAAIDSKGQKAA